MARSAPTAALLERLEPLAARHQRFLFAALALPSLFAAWLHRFVLDDAFISFIYARNLAEGHGLTWFGARTEGYTNFLWVLWMALGFRGGVEPVAWSRIGGMASFLAALWGAWQLARFAFHRTIPAVLLVLLLVTNYTFLRFATSGLETMLQAALLTWAAVCLLHLRREQRATRRLSMTFSLLLAAACLTRPDSALPGLVLAISATASLPPRQRFAAPGLLLYLPATVLIGGSIVWKLAYYHTCLPNSFYAKVGADRAGAWNGLLYLGRFLHWYLLWPVFALGLLALWFRRKRSRVPRPRATPLALSAVLLLWFGYVIVVGGDFMEFRFLVPVTPLLFLLLTDLVTDEIGPLLRPHAWLAPLGVLLLLTVASARHAHGFRGVTTDRTLDSIPILSTFYGAYPPSDWSLIGDRLGRELAEARPVLGLQAVGAIPFYSRLETVDMLGLNDAYVARHGWKPPPAYHRPGHRRQATTAYLRERGVNFVLGHPMVLPRSVLTGSRGADRILAWFPLGPDAETSMHQAQQVVLFPVEPGRDLLMWYLSHTPALDELIRRNGWPVVTVQLGG